MISRSCITTTWRVGGVSSITSRYITKNYVVLIDKSHSVANMKRGLDELTQLSTDTRSMSVTNFITQYDEFRQIDDASKGIERTSAEMAKGNTIHKVLEASMKTLLRPMPEIDHTYGDVTTNDMRFLQFWNKFASLNDESYRFLQKGGINQDSDSVEIREMFMYGKLPFQPSWQLRGIIDCVKLTPSGLMILETKTTKYETVTSEQLRLAYHQAMTYHYMLNDILKLAETDSATCASTLFDVFGVKNDIIRKEFLNSQDIVHSTIQNLANVGMESKVQIEIVHTQRNLSDIKPRIRAEERTGDYAREYECDLYEVPFDQEALIQVLQSRADLFEGKRKPYTFSLKQLKLPLKITDKVPLQLARESRKAPEVNTTADTPLTLHEWLRYEYK